MMRLTHLFLAFALYACASSATEKNQDAAFVAVDTSGKVAVDPTIATPNSIQEPVSESGVGFPSYSEDVFSDDTLEAHYATPLFALLDQYKGEKLYIVRSEYTVVYQISNEYDESALEDITRTESKTWYYDSAMNVRVFSRDMVDGDANNSEILLFDEGNVLVAFYADDSYGGQDLVSMKDRCVMSKCPNCGIRLVSNTADMEVPRIDMLDSANVASMRERFEKDYWAMKSFLQSVNGAEKSGSQYRIEKPVTYQGTPCTIVYTFDERTAKAYVLE